MRSRSTAYARSTTLTTCSLSGSAATRPLGRRHADRQPLDAVEEVRAQPLGRAGELDPAHARQQLLEGDPHLQAREVRAHAEVHAAGAERQVRVRRAGDVEAV